MIFAQFFELFEARQPFGSTHQRHTKFPLLSSATESLSTIKHFVRTDHHGGNDEPCQPAGG